MVRVPITRLHDGKISIIFRDNKEVWSAAAIERARNGYVLRHIAENPVEEGDEYLHQCLPDEGTA